MRELCARLRALLRWAFHWGHRRIPPGLRSLIGVLLIVAGVFGFLPILGFWMAPVGVVLLALDVPPLRRRLGERLESRPGQDGEDREPRPAEKAEGDH